MIHDVPVTVVGIVVHYRIDVTVVGMVGWTCLLRARGRGGGGVGVGWTWRFLRLHARGGGGGVGVG